MRKNLIYFITFIILTSFSLTSFWLENNSWLTITTTFSSWEEQVKNNIILENNLTRWNIFNFFWDNIWSKIPESYKYIKLNFTDIEENTELYDSLQKLVYLDLIKNVKIKINPDKNLDLYTFYKMSEKIFWLNIITLTDKTKLLSEITKSEDLNKMLDLVDLAKSAKKAQDLMENTKKSKVEQKKQIFTDVYNTLLDNYYDKSKIDEEKYVEWAIEWLTNSLNDKFSVYFPPTQSKDFLESLSWEYEWIWSYVDMETPWVLKIVSPIPWSPAEKAWLKWWDIVTKVDLKEVTKENSLAEVISWIKWPAWTKVKLTIKREDKIFDVDVERAKIIINDVDYKSLNDEVYYIQIKSFWDHVRADFKKALDELSTKKSVKKVILDLRNNWGWYLSEVADMLSYFVPLNQPTAYVKYINDDESYFSSWYNLVDFTKYRLIILENSWTASASEILIWTLKDYYPNATIIWEKSYGKWSVQTIKPYVDWSSLKYTIAKWFTWKTKTWIDKVGIKPDIELELNIEDFKKGTDNQLDKAKSID